MTQTEFHKLWAASAASNLSDGITLVAAPLLAAGLAFAQRVPWLLFALLSGALADRLDRRRAMAAAAACRAVLIGGLGLAVLVRSLAACWPRSLAWRRHSGWVACSASSC